MTVIQSFETMLSKLEPTTRQKGEIQTKRETIDSVLQNDRRIFLAKGNQSSFFTGSYKRNTIIRPIDDIDLYVTIHYGQHAHGKWPTHIMRLMANALGSRYPQTRIKVDSPCIAIKFLSFKFEVVPTVFYEDDEDRYKIPGPGAREWIDCYPHIPQKWMTNSNYINNKKFIPLIKILKQWNRHNKVGLQSFHLELLTGMVFAKLSDVLSYPQAVYDWMYYVCKWIDENNSPFVNEPGKYYHYVDDYLYSNKFKLNSVRQKIKHGLKRAELAMDSWAKGNELQAKRLWYQIFGDMFPAPIQSVGKTLLTSYNPSNLSSSNLSEILSPPKPSLLEMLYKAQTTNRPKTILTDALSQRPKQVNKGLLELLAEYKKIFP
jgi:hypothetical protein